MKKSILFVCHGNICCSVSAQYIFENLVHQSGLDRPFLVDSAATSREEIGSPIYPPMDGPCAGSLCPWEHTVRGSFAEKIMISTIC